MLTKDTVVGIIGAGTMASGIAMVAASAGHRVVVTDINAAQLNRAKDSVKKNLDRQIEKKKLSEMDAGIIFNRLSFSDSTNSATKKLLAPAGLIIEAIVEDLETKQETFCALEAGIASDCVLASNTSSLSITSIAAGCRMPQRVIGLHFFNPAHVMPLVEIVPGIKTSPGINSDCEKLLRAWGKSTVLAKDTPGFIVNRIARPFYGEALRILEEGVTDVATIDWAMKEIGGFKMGPFELIDLIGADVNFQVTKSVYAAFFQEPRYRPSLTQQRMVEAGLLGRKSGAGFYSYDAKNASPPQPKKDEALGQEIFLRILAMLINEAADALFLQIASRDDIDRAMTLGVNYPKGLLKWCDELGIDKILGKLSAMHEEYGEDRYRPSPLLRRMAKSKQLFYHA